ncbi:hypothetical protein RFI_27742 [Reticulomyxa filosa]|uniref:Uncharacterized protein n=1 Tax=Reticulomyxa filosa TaxID=46433 RepID=X6M6T8_RETFI|nr:hypothetical protein RFI_27742 [Reticulomyxa filosa]|eukprot:ETO09634.1 hypothetical protein RFI_27742 [Reticulomyxa filosa]
MVSDSNNLAEFFSTKLSNDNFSFVKGITYMQKKFRMLQTPTTKVWQSLHQTMKHNYQTTFGKVFGNTFMLTKANGLCVCPCQKKILEEKEFSILAQLNLFFLLLEFEFVANEYFEIPNSTNSGSSNKDLRKCIRNNKHENVWRTIGLHPIVCFEDDISWRFNPTYRVSFQFHKASDTPKEKAATRSFHTGNFIPSASHSDKDDNNNETDKTTTPHKTQKQYSIAFGVLSGEMGISQINKVIHAQQNWSVEHPHGYGFEFSGYKTVEDENIAESRESNSINKNAKNESRNNQHNLATFSEGDEVTIQVNMRRRELRLKSMASEPTPPSPNYRKLFSLLSPLTLQTLKFLLHNILFFH